MCQVFDKISFFSYKESSLGNTRIGNTRSEEGYERKRAGSGKSWLLPTKPSHSNFYWGIDINRDTGNFIELWIDMTERKSDKNGR